MGAKNGKKNKAGKDKARKEQKILTLATAPVDGLQDIRQKFAAALSELIYTGFFVSANTEHNRRAPTYRIHSEAGGEFIQRMKLAISGLNELSELSYRVGQPGMAMMFGVQACQAAINFGEHNSAQHETEAAVILNATLSKLRTTARIITQLHRGTPVAAQAARTIEVLELRPYLRPVDAFDKLQRELTARNAGGLGELLAMVVAAGQAAEPSLPHTSGGKGRAMSQQANGAKGSHQPEHALN